MCFDESELKTSILKAYPNLPIRHLKASIEHSVRWSSERNLKDFSWSLEEFWNGSEIEMVDLDSDQCPEVFLQPNIIGEQGSGAVAVYIFKVDAIKPKFLGNISLEGKIVHPEKEDENRLKIKPASGFHDFAVNHKIGFTVFKYSEEDGYKYIE
jgi:hypothetical protein